MVRTTTLPGRPLFRACITQTVLSKLYLKEYHRW